MPTCKRLPLLRPLRPCGHTAPLRYDTCFGVRGAFNGFCRFCLAKDLFKQTLIELQVEVAFPNLFVTLCVCGGAS